MSEENQRSEALFDTLNKKKKKRKRRVLYTVLIVIAVIIAALVILVLSLRHKVEQQFASAAAEVQSYTVQTGTINTVVTGSGILTQEELEQLAVPAGVEITEVLVESGDTVKQGDLLATVDMATVMTALSGAQEQLDDLDSDIADAKGDTVSSYIRSGVSGRVKILYAKPDMDVSACMAEYGALAVLSLDGYMAVDLETEQLNKGDTVTVVRSDGKEIRGTVDSVLGGKATVLVTDNGPEYDEEVTVLTEDGTNLGSGQLYIHNPLAVTGYAGTVSSVSTSENAQVYNGTTLFRLKDTGFSANYDALLRSRSDLEETLMDLLTIYRDGAVLSPMDGTVSSVEYDEDTAILTGETETNLLTLYPDRTMSVTISVDETDILALELGQEAEVVVSSVSDEVFLGTVTDIDKTAATSTGVTLYSAVITLDKRNGMLPGMTADVDVKIQGVENAMIIPVDALHQTSTISYVYTSFDEETQRYGGMAEVTTGMRSDNYVEILSGLNVGDTVYYTKSDTFDFRAMFGSMGNMGGSMPSGSGMPSGGGQMPEGMGGGRGNKYQGG